MSRRLGALTLDTLEDLPPRCRRCVAWELDPGARRRAQQAGDLEFEKEAWLSGVLLEWGSCGRIAYAGDTPAGFVTYAPPVHSPRASRFPTSPVAADAVLLMTGWVSPEHRGGGFARMLVQGAAKDLTRRGVRAIEAFGTVSGDAVAADGLTARDVPGVPAATDDPDSESHLCLLPVGLLLAVGFKTVRPHRHTPRLRLDLRTALSWREDVEQALERILGTVRVPVLAGG